MLVYRIVLDKWATSLVGSGRAARWNSNGRFMLYTASTRALACLENLAHRRSVGKDELYKTVIIRVPSTLNIKEIKKEVLPINWMEFSHYRECQLMGDRWLDQQESVVLKVPSAIIPEEYNYLLNPQHSDFKRIKIQLIEDFVFDERIAKKI